MFPPEIIHLFLQEVDAAGEDVHHHLWVSKAFYHAARKVIFRSLRVPLVPLRSDDTTSIQHIRNLLNILRISPETVTHTQRLEIHVPLVDNHPIFSPPSAPHGLDISALLTILKTAPITELVVSSASPDFTSCFSTVEPAVAQQVFELRRLPTLRTLRVSRLEKVPAPLILGDSQQPPVTKLTLDGVSGIFQRAPDAVPTPLQEEDPFRAFSQLETLNVAKGEDLYAVIPQAPYTLDLPETLSFDKDGETGPPRLAIPFPCVTTLRLFNSTIFLHNHEYYQFWNIVECVPVVKEIVLEGQFQAYSLHHLEFLRSEGIIGRKKSLSRLSALSLISTNEHETLHEILRDGVLTFIRDIAIRTEMLQSLTLEFNWIQNTLDDVAKFPREPWRELADVFAIIPSLKSVSLIFNPYIAWGGVDTSELATTNRVLEEEVQALSLELKGRAAGGVDISWAITATYN